MKDIGTFLKDMFLSSQGLMCQFSALIRLKRDLALMRR
jgi:hypothetical protein